MNFLKEIYFLRNNTKGLLFIIFFRISNFFTWNKFLRIIGLPVRITYKILIQWILGIDISDKATIGFGFTLFHGQSVVINKNAKIGKYVIIRQNTTIGNSKSDGNSPVIGDFVNIGANCVIIGDIKIGDHVIIGAGSVITKNIDPMTVVAGNPAKELRKIRQ